MYFIIILHTYMTHCQSIKNTSCQIIHDFYKKNIPTSLCFIHPNMITLFRASLLIPLVDNIKNNESILTSSLLTLVITLLDHFDGAQARKCNTSSNIGMTLDQTFDFLLGAIALFYCIVKTFKIKTKIYIKIYKNKKIVLNHVHIFIISFLFIFLINKVEMPFAHHNRNMMIESNIAIFTFIGMLLIKLYLNNYTKTIKEIDSNK